MAGKEEIAALLERVKLATGPSADIDLPLLEIAGLGYYDYTRSHYEYEVGNPNRMDLTRPWGKDYPSRSVDHALALVERVLPGWTVAHLTQGDDKTWFCELREGYLTSYNRVAMSETSYGKPRPANLPLAILQALLTALSETSQ